MIVSPMARSMQQTRLGAMPWIMAAAGAWVLFVSLFAPGLGEWQGSHSHQTLAGFVPVHSHAYGKTSGDGTSCGSSSVTGSASRVVCTPGEDLTGGGMSVLPASGPVGMLQPAAATSESVPIERARYADFASSGETPPPRD